MCVDEEEKNSGNHHPQYMANRVGGKNTLMTVLVV